MYQIRTPRGRTSTCFLLFINDFGRFQSRTPKTKRFKIGGKTFEMTENEPPVRVKNPLIPLFYNDIRLPTRQESCISACDADAWSCKT